jgi:hypothetical protein
MNAPLLQMKQLVPFVHYLQFATQAVHMKLALAYVPIGQLDTQFP